MISPKADYLFEISWEVCNKVGGIYTLVKSKANIMTQNYKNYFLIGPYFEEHAMIELERYLDLAQLSGWNEIRIIHGKGTGALRKSIHMYLRKNSMIKSFNLAKYGQGDTGVTVIKI